MGNMICHAKNMISQSVNMMCHVGNITMIMINMTGHVGLGSIHRLGCSEAEEIRYYNQPSMG